jgi:hypothetical protein
MTGDAKAPGPKISAPDAPNFEAHIPKLLEYAGIEDTSLARYWLNCELIFAWVEGDAERERQNKQPMADLSDRLSKSIKKTLRLLRQLEKFPQWQMIGFDRCATGEGTVSVRSAGGTVGIPKNPQPLGSFPEVVAPGGTLALINRHRVLERLQREIDYKKRNRKRGNQEEHDKSLIVTRAVSFFRQYSLVEPTTYFDGPCVKFCRRFYEAVTGVKLGPSGLEKQIRKELEED